MRQKVIKKKQDETNNKKRLAVSAQQDLENQIKTLKKELTTQQHLYDTKLNAAKDEFKQILHKASHDLRSYLQYIIGFSELLQEDCSGLLDDKGNQHLKTILEASQMARQLLDNLVQIENINIVNK